MKSHLSIVAALLGIIFIQSDPSFPQPPRAKALARVKLTIDKVEPNAFGFDVTISVRNTGNQPIIIGTDGDELRSLDVQQHDEKVGWERVGRCKDVPIRSSTVLRPDQTITNVVPAVDPKGRPCCSVCPRKLRFLRGPIRAILYFGYANEHDFKDRLRSKPLIQNVTSDVMNLPVAAEMVR